MTRRRIRHLPVIDADGDGKDRMVGFVSIGDLVKVRIEHIEAEAEAMRSSISRRRDGGLRLSGDASG